MIVTMCHYYQLYFKMDITYSVFMLYSLYSLQFTYININLVIEHTLLVEILARSLYTI